MDGDGIADIIFSGSEEIYAVRGTDGKRILGFPLYVNSAINGNACVADIDNDGKNEIVCIDSDSHVYVWKTDGKPSAIEWGSERHDQHNTGEYAPFCEPVYINSNTTWNGITPCGNVIVNAGKFTVPSGSTLPLGNTSKIIVRSGATLEIDGGTVSNAYIRALPGGSVVLKNNGTVSLRTAGNFEIDPGATFDNLYGNVLIKRTDPYE